MFEPRIVGYLCTWCSYTGADVAGTARLKYPANLRAVRVPCSGRVSPEWIMRAFDEGADGVLVLACHIGECHYDSGNHRTAKRLPILRALLALAGLEPERLRLDYVSASEGERFARIVGEFTETVRALGPCGWRIRGERLEAGGTRGQGQPVRVGRQWIAPERTLPEGRWSDEASVRPVRISLRGGEPEPAAMEITRSIRATARDLLSGEQVDCVIGYEQGTRGRARPAFVRRPEDADRLVWNPACTHNLTTYLRDHLRPEKKGAPPRRAAVVVKPCDSRAVHVLLAEGQFAREQVHVIGVACPGIAGADGAPQARCLSCAERTPVLYDTLAGEPPAAPEPAPDLPDDLAALEPLEPLERMSFWLSQFDRCQRCYACRQACPMCRCPACLYERDDSLWTSLRTGLSEKRAFHLGRAFHLAGRCVGCNECERACPMNIPISLLNRKLAQEVQAAFGHTAGLAVAASPLVSLLSGEEVLAP